MGARAGHDPGRHRIARHAQLFDQLADLVDVRADQHLDGHRVEDRHVGLVAVGSRTLVAIRQQRLQAFGEQRDLRTGRPQHALGEEPDDDREARHPPLLVVLLHDEPVQATVAVDARVHEGLVDHDDPMVFELVADVLGDLVSAPGFEEATARVRAPHAETGARNDLDLEFAADPCEPVAPHADQDEATARDPVEEAADLARALLTALDHRRGELQVGHQFADRQDHAAVVRHHVRHPAHHLPQADLEIAAGRRVGQRRDDLRVDVRVEGRSVGRLVDRGQRPLGVALHREQRVDDDPNLRLATLQLEAEGVDDERTIVLQHLDDGVTRAIVGIAHAHPDLAGREPGDPVEGLDRHRRENRFAADVVIVDAAQQTGGKAPEQGIALGRDGAGGAVDQSVERVAGCRHEVRRRTVVARRGGRPRGSGSQRAPRLSSAAGAAKGPSGRPSWRFGVPGGTSTRRSTTKPASRPSPPRRPPSPRATRPVWRTTTPVRAIGGRHRTAHRPGDEVALRPENLRRLLPTVG